MTESIPENEILEVEVPHVPEPEDEDGVSDPDQDEDDGYVEGVDAE